MVNEAKNQDAKRSHKNNHHNSGGRRSRHNSYRENRKKPIASDNEGDFHPLPKSMLSKQTQRLFPVGDEGGNNGGSYKHEKKTQRDSTSKDKRRSSITTNDRNHHHNNNNNNNNNSKNNNVVSGDKMNLPSRWADDEGTADVTQKSKAHGRKSRHGSHSHHHGSGSERKAILAREKANTEPTLADMIRSAGNNKSNGRERNEKSWKGKERNERRGGKNERFRNERVKNDRNIKSQRHERRNKSKKDRRYSKDDKKIENPQKKKEEPVLDEKAVDAELAQLQTKLDSAGSWDDWNF